jgi:lactate permease
LEKISMDVLFVQRLDPLDGMGWGASVLLSTMAAAFPVLVLLYCLVFARMRPPLAGLVGTVAALVLAVLVWGMPVGLSLLAFAQGALFGLMPIGFTVFAGLLLYNLTVESGAFELVRTSVGRVSGDPRLQAVLVSFCFGAFLEGAAGFGAPVAICGAILVGLGFPPVEAAVLCLIANTSPVAYGSLGVPLVTLHSVTGIDTPTLSVMAGHQLPLFSVFVPAVMLARVCSARDLLAIWPALLVAGGSFAGFQYFFATAHVHGFGELYPLTDIGGGIFSLVATALFLRFWSPPPMLDPLRGGPWAQPGGLGVKEPAVAWPWVRAWMPFVLMSVLLMGAGWLRQQEEKSPIALPGGIASRVQYPLGKLHLGVQRDPKMRSKPDEREKAVFDFRWLTASGTSVLVAFGLSVVVLGASAGQAWSSVRKTARQMTEPLPTIAFMLGLAAVTKYSGMDATLGHAFARTGVLYPFFAAMLGWLGVFLTGSDSGSNALFGSLQKLTALELHGQGHMAGLDAGQAQVLICTSNSTGGVMGKMIDAQSIVVATAATNQMGQEANIFRIVVVYSVVLAALVGLLVMLQAYVPALAFLVPSLMSSST